MACFVPEYTGIKKTGRNPAIDAIFMIVPPLFLLIFDFSFKSFLIKSIPISVELTVPVLNSIKKMIKVQKKIYRDNFLQS